MPMRCLVIITAICLPASVCFGQTETTAKYEPVTYPDLGLRVEIPSPYQKHTFPADGDTLRSEVFIAGDYAYTIKVTKTPANSIASTAIEQAIQAEVKSAPASYPAKRWELDSRRKELFKGITKGFEFDAAAMMRQPHLEKICKGKECVESLAMAPLKDESSPIVTVGVIGPKTPGNDVEVKAKYVAFTLTTTPPRPATADLHKRNGAAPPIPPMPSTPTVTAKPTAPSVRPTPAIRPSSPVGSRPPIGVSTIPTTPAPVPAPSHSIKRGDIELIGSVQSIAPERTSLTMLVAQIRMPGQTAIPLTPARQKTVYLTKVPASISAGARVIVIGRNTGVGKPITADVLESAHGF
ncbi:MAG: hypothetical protein M1133_10775 [Armatimonadetes bacterium]|nr:hypothetical protein [Armatimonadota bacterium]